MSSPDPDEFRARVWAFLAANARRRGVEGETRDDDTVRRVQAAKTYQKALADAGLAGLTYPVEYGGQGLDRSYQEAFGQEAAGYVLPTMPFSISHGMCLPVLNQFGTHAQKAAHLAKIISGEEIWAQMFSEPGAGSDVASLQMRAVRDGDQWVLNGQKVWTSGAHYCDYGLVVARTDPNLPKHDGLSMFMIDLRAAGVEIRPLRQINGNSDFNEVFLTDLHIPADWIVGDLNRGWGVAVAMLMFERVAIGAGGGGASGAGYRTIAAAARERGLTADPILRDQLARLYINEQILKLIGQRIRAASESGRVPGPEGSIAKLAGAKLALEAAAAGMAVAGTSGQAWERNGDDAERWADAVLTAPALGIAGGTNEVQRNIIGERVLGLPGDIKVDKGVPFSELLVGTQSRAGS